ncbi:MAG: nucleotide exchange factor GrpE [Thermoleophilia bacterium]
MVEATEVADTLLQPDPEAGDPAEAVRRERDDYLDALQRLKAEFDNYRKRVERDRELIRTAAVREVVTGVLPVLDNLERAVLALGKQGVGLAEGVEMVRAQLSSVLSGHGLVEVETVGQHFDPTTHEAIAAIPAPGTVEGQIIEVVEKGYRAGDDLVRAAKVVVSAGDPANGQGHQ